MLKIIDSKMNVYLNIYDLTRINSLFTLCGLGAFHTGVEINKVEYSYGYSNSRSTGVYISNPKQEYRLRKTVLLG